MSQKFEERLLTHLIDGQPLTAEDQLVLEKDTDAQLALAAMQAMLNELTTARQSQPSPAAIARYAELFSQVQTRTKPSLVEGITATLADFAVHIQATLAWDSRQQLAMQGARSAAGQSYRLLYSAGSADIEMLVEPEGKFRHITGEVMPLESAIGGGHSTPLLLHLLQPQSGIAFADAVSDAEGAFRLDPVMPGRYKLLVTPSQGAVLEVASLEIT